MKLKEYKIEAWDNKAITKRLKFGSYFILLLKIDESKYPIRESIKNLIAVDKDDVIQWIAHLPKGEEIYSSYNNVEIKNDMLLGFCNSHLCVIDPCTGQIVKQQFVK